MSRTDKPVAAAAPIVDPPLELPANHKPQRARAIDAVQVPPIKISELPPHVDLDAKRDEWIGIGLSCEPADWGAAEDAIIEAYRLAKPSHPPPERFERLGSPKAGAMRQSELITGKARPRDLGKCCYGAMATWLSYYDTLAPLINHTALMPHVAIAKSCGWWWPINEVAVVTDRPLWLHRDDQHRLHHPTGHAIRYRDGWGFYAWHGLRVPIYVMESVLTADMINNESNDEYRRIMLERYGMIRYLDEISAKPIDTCIDEAGNLVRLYKVGDVRRLRLVNSTPDPDGSSREYVQLVPGPRSDPSLVARYGDAYNYDSAQHARMWLDQQPLDHQYDETS